jgi:uncharacterized membrane protein
MIYVLEAIFDMAGEWIIGNYFKLMTAISPKFKSKKLLYAFLGIIFIAFIFGLACLFIEEPVLKTIGIYAMAISISLILINLVIGVVFKIFKNKNK